MKTMKFSSENIEFLGIGEELPVQDFVSEPIQIWKKYLDNGTMETLMNLCQAKKVYCLIGHRYDHEQNTVSYHIVCENIAGCTDDRFERIKVDPSTYFAFEMKANEASTIEMSNEALFEEIYKQWLPKSDYEAKVDPYTNLFCQNNPLIETITPQNMTSVSSVIELWLPVK